MQKEYKNVSALFYVIACLLHKKKPSEREFEKIEIMRLFDIAKKHSLASITYTALEGTEILEKADIKMVKEWKDIKEKTIRKNILLDVEKEQIVAELENKHIWYMPLKGSVIKSLYPNDCMREMADIDILFDSKYREAVKRIFKEKGYSVESYLKGNHDVYFKKPIYNFEMHTSLFVSTECPKTYEFFKNIDEKLISVNEDACEKKFSNEDNYLYFIAHNYKHHMNAGTGLRAIVDFFVLYNHFYRSMDWDYITSNLHRMEINHFETLCRELSFYLLKEPVFVDLTTLSTKRQNMIYNFVSSGTYGTIEKFVVNNMKKYSKDGSVIDIGTKTRYILSRLFPSSEKYKVCLPIVGKFPVFMPFVWIYRPIRALIFRRKDVIKEIRTMINH